MVSPRVVRQSLVEYLSRTCCSWFIAPTAFLLISLSCTGCSLPSVTVETAAPTVERVFQRANYAAPELKSEFDETARTTWFFRCLPSFDYDIVKESRRESEFDTTLRVSRVQMRLELPIKVIASETAPASVIAHESGHVTICKIIYAGADVIARRAAERVTGEQFSGRGIDREASRQAALDQAGEKIAEKYRQETVEKVNDISELYDQICITRRSMPVESAVQEAFRLYKRNHRQP